MARKKVTYDLKLSLEYAAAIVRTQGYVSKKDAYPTVSNPLLIFRLASVAANVAPTVVQATPQIIPPFTSCTSFMLNSRITFSLYSTLLFASVE